MKRTVSIVSLSAILLLLSSVVYAASIPSVGTSPGGDRHIFSVEKWYTSGNTMEGFQITVTYEDDTTDVAHWVNGTGAIGTDWSVDFSSDWLSGAALWNENQFQWYVNWDITNSGTQDIKEIVFEGMTDYSDLVFDVIYDPSTTGINEYTPQSLNGRPITLSGGPDDLTIDAQYSDRVLLKQWNSVTGAFEYVWYTDLYANLTLTFENSVTGGYLAPGEVVSFAADLDNVNVSVPEPATMLLMGLGLTGLVGSRFRRRRK